MNDAARLAIVKRYQNVIQLPDRCFENVAFLAAEICEVPAAFITFVDSEKVSVQASVGTRVQSFTAKGESLFEYCLKTPEFVQITDEKGLATEVDLEDEHAKFFATTPIITNGGFVVGALSVAGREVKSLKIREQMALKRLAGLIAEHLETKLKAFTVSRSSETIHLLNEITGIANDAQELKPSVQRALAAVCRYFGSSVGHYAEGDSAQGIWYLLEPSNYEDFMLARVQALKLGDDRTVYSFPVLLKNVKIGTVELLLSATSVQEQDLATVATHFAAQVARLTERFRAERATETHQRFLDGVLENLSDGVVACDAQGNLTLFNRATRDFHLLELRSDIPQEEVSKYYGLLCADGKTELPFEEIPIIRALNGQEVKNFDMVIRSRGGKKRRIRASGRTMYDKDGQLIGAVSTYKDLTETENALSKLEAAKRTLETLIETSPAGIIVFDNEMRISIWNSGSEKMYGWTKEECIGVSMKDATDPVSIETRKSLETLRETRGRLEVEAPRYCKDGNFITVKASVVPLINEHDEVDGFISVMVDISDLAKKEADLIALNSALKAADDAKSRFLAKMSHELCTPLNHVIGMSEYVLETKLDFEQKSFLDEINQSGENLLTMVNQILDFSRVEAKEVALDLRVFDFKSVLANIESEFAPSAREKGLDFKFAIEGVQTKFHGDSHRIQQVIENLVRNAIRFTDRGFVSTHVTLLDVSGDSSVNRTRVLVDVQDSGTGIPAEKIGKVFEAFAQADDSSTRKVGGAGLGLSIAKSLVQLMNGQIGVESEPMKGSRFWFYVDLEDAEEKFELSTSA